MLQRRRSYINIKQKGKMLNGGKAKGKERKITGLPSVPVPLFQRFHIGQRERKQTDTRWCPALPPGRRDQGRSTVTGALHPPSALVCVAFVLARNASAFSCVVSALVCGASALVRGVSAFSHNASVFSRGCAVPFILLSNILTAGAVFAPASPFDL